MNILEYQQYYLVGIKGVAMTSLAQCLCDAQKTLRGSDVAEDFVTADILRTLHIPIDVGFEHHIPAETQCVIYTAAHKAAQNPQVLAAQQAGIPTYTHAEALAALFNEKKGIAVCGVGGKSTTSAMISWILEKTGRQPSFSVGVGNIQGLGKTGQWHAKSTFFVAEADEYVIDPSAPSRGEKITPRFSFLHPFITICTNLQFDHPDVYKNFDHTKAVFAQFFRSMKQGGTLIINGDDLPLRSLAQEVSQETGTALITVGESDGCTFQMVNFQSQEGKSYAHIQHQKDTSICQLLIPGKYNSMNALFAIAAAKQAGIPISESIAALANFRSTLRRCEYVGEKHGVKFYDDYAHHPMEIQKVIHAYREWYPSARLVVGFQSHTFSRTKSLFSEFTTAFAQASEVVMIDIFPSAREKFDPTITSDGLCEAIHAQFPKIPAHNVHTIDQLAEYCHTHLQPGDIFLTLGAGDIYLVHQRI